ncbi:E2 protein [Human papillomavirus 88]|uniref:Regulatory protein E2 n=1 Tax=Human papillomavirus 88 TaxID=337054 RepID=A8R8N3_9PAPI|nr:E2 protein [Human papillomavirus type 88]ABR20505.1 E2 protein [Human papillomavirus type 88]
MARMETQETLTERFVALQDAILNLIERGETDLRSQIQYWELVRKEQVILYYARKSGYNRLGLQPTPAPAVSEYNAKQAIHLQLMLKSLEKSKFAKEPWSLTDASAELVNTPPRDCFKKGGFTVTVYFDNDRENSFPYTQWEHIYYQDQNEQWHKVPGGVDHNGLYYDEENTNERVYFLLFEPESQKYGSSGQWTVHYKNTTVSASATSSSRRSSPISTKTDFDATTAGNTTTSAPQRSPRKRLQEAVSSTTSPPAHNLRSPGRGRGEGERTSGAKRRRTATDGNTLGESVPSPSQVGSRHRAPERSGLSRLGRLQADAWDPPLIIIKGPANTLKCWRNRMKKNSSSNLVCSSVWRWIDSTTHENSRMLVAFQNTAERTRFLNSVTLPKGTTYAFGYLDSL